MLAPIVPLLVVADNQVRWRWLPQRSTEATTTMADQTKYPQADPFVAPGTSPQASDHRQDTATTERPDMAPARTATRPKDDDEKDTRSAAQKRTDRQQAATAKADREAERGKRDSAYAYGQAGVGNPTGSADGPGTRTYAHRQCGTEIEVPADQSGPAESKCMGCRMDVAPSDWILRE